MSQDFVSHWVEKAKSAQSAEVAGTGSIKVIRREEPKSKGAIIMEIADKLLPWVRTKLNDVRDNEGGLVQLATMRGIALNMAQDVMKAQE